MIEQQPIVTDTNPIVTDTTVVSLTDAAASKLRELTKDETNPDIGLRVYVYSGGCSGFRYGMMLEDAPTPEDNILVGERHQGLRRRLQRRPPAGLADRLRRHAHGRRLHGQQPERGRGLWLRLELPHRRRRWRAQGLQPLILAPRAITRSRRATAGFAIPGQVLPGRYRRPMGAARRMPDATAKPTAAGAATTTTDRPWHHHATVRRPGIGSTRPAAEAG